jgi:filamentous hemagglutinin
MTTIHSPHALRQGLNTLAFAVAVALLGTPVAGQAQAVPDARAGLHRPGTDTAANGVPVVNIVAPSAGGVSHNQFQSFDVDGKGLILNNSGAVSQTRLAGMIVGNTNLGAGPSARIILNEVTGTRPSALNGYTEVAGKAADVIVANPNGISVNGGGFINTTRGVLTTGTPVFGGDGSLQAFRVTRGAIAINGGGLDATGPDRLDLIARAVQANAKVWAHNLNVVTGANQVGYADLATQAIQGEGTVPGVSLDVAALGGMYADKIHLLGTEAGVGVRASGEIAAQAGDFRLTSAGKLVVTGKLTATGDLAVDAGGIDNGGTLAANGRLDVHASGDVGNSGTLYAGRGLDLSGTGAVANAGLIHADADATLQVASLSNTGSIESVHDLSLTSQGRLINQGTMLAGGGNLMLSAGEFDNGGSVDAADRLALQAGALTNTGLLRSGAAQTVRVDGKANNQGTAYAGTAAQWTVAGQLANTGTLAAQGDLDIGADSLDSSGVLGAGVQTDGSLAGAGTLSVDTTAALVAQGRNLAAATLDFRGASLDLDGATTRAGGAIGLTATQGALSLRNGDLATNDSLALQAAGQLDNSDGTLQAGQVALAAASVVNRGGHVLQTGTAASTLAVSGAFDNSAGSIASNAGALTLAAGSLLNAGGSIAHAGSGRLTLDVGGQLDNGAGSIAGNGALQIVAGGAFANAAGNVSAAGDASLQAQSLDNRGGTLAADTIDITLAQSLLNTGGEMQAGGGLTVHADALTNGTGQIKALGGDALSLYITHALNNATDGFIAGNGAVNLQAGSVANAGQVYAGGDLVLASGGALDNRNGALQAMGAVTASATGKLSNGHGRIEAGGGRSDATLSLTATSLDNSAGRVANAAQGATTLNLGSGALTNTGGTLGGQGDVTVSAGAIGNTGSGVMVAGRDLSLTATGLDNTNGTLYAARNLAWSNRTATLTNRSGHLGAGGNTVLALATLENTGGETAASGNVTLDLGSLAGSGRVVAGNDLDLTLAGNYTNVAGNTLKANRNATLTFSGNLDNASGATLSAVGALAVKAAGITNSGTIDSAATSLTATGALTNGGRIEGDTVALTAASVGNTGTLIGDGITVHAGSLTNGSDLGSATDNTAYDSAVIAATGDIDLYLTGTLLNRDALIYAMGDLTVAANAGGGRATAITNRSGSIEADGSIALAASQITNERRVFATETYTLTGAEQAVNTTSEQHVVDKTTDPVAVAYCAGLGKNHRCDPDENATGQTTSTVISQQRLLRTSAQGRIVSGADIALGGSVLNDKSTIAAAGHLVVNGQSGSVADGAGTLGGESIVNTGWVPTVSLRTDVDNWIQVQKKSKCGGGLKTCWDDDSIEHFGQTSTTADLSIAGTPPYWMNITPGPDAPAYMTAGGTLSVTGTTIANTTVGADGRPVNASAALGSNAAGHAATGAGAGHVGSVGAGDALSGASAPGLQTVGSPGAPAGSIQLPSNGLFTTHPGASAGYLVETDPRFASMSGFYGSDYLMDRLPWNGEDTLKRLGDAFYENRLVLNQITALTGRRFLTNDTDAIAQYRALMDAGVTAAGQFDLSVGVALTAAQMASLSDDIVWLVSQEVNGEKVLVPVVYLSAQHAKNLGSERGAVMAGQDIILDASGTLTNTGNVLASRDASLKAGTLLNSGNLSAADTLSISAAQDVLNAGRIQGGNVAVVAGRDVVSGADLGKVDLGGVNLGDSLSPVDAQRLGLATGGRISASSSLAVQAGRDLVLNQAPVSAGRDLSLVAGRDLTATAAPISAGGDAALVAGRDLGLTATEQTVVTGGGTSLTHTTTHTVSSVTAGGNLALSAGRDITSEGAAFKAGDVLAASAGRDVNLNAVTDVTTTSEHHKEGRTSVSTSSLDETLRGTTLDAANGIVISAGRDITTTAANLASSDGAIALGAGHDITLDAGVESHDTTRDTKYKKSGLFSSKTTITHDETHDTYAVGTTLSGDSVTVAAGHDLTTRAAQVAGTHDVTLAAGHDVTIGTAEEVSTETYSVAKKKSGLFSGGGASGLGGIGVTAGSQKANATDTVEQHLTVGSLIGSTEGNLTVAAGGDLAVIGSDLIAQRAVGASSGGNIALQGKNITITSATQTDHETTTQQASSHGVSMAMVGTARDGLRNVQQTRREKAGSGKKAQDTLHALSAAGLDMPGIAFSYGSQRSDQSSQVDTTTERGSTLRAAGDLTLNATGGDLTVIGSALSAGGTATLAAQHNVALLTSVDTQSSSSQSSNHSKSFTAAPVGWGDAARSLQGGANSSGVRMSPYNSQSGIQQNGQQIVNETGTTVDAGQISVISRQGDIVAEGAQLTAQHDINVLASQGKIDLGTGEASQQQQSHQRGHQVGDLGGNGYAGTIGERQEVHDQNGKQTWQSTLRTGLTSEQGDVNVVAHGDLTGQGVDIAGRDVTLVGRNVTLTPSADTADQQQRDAMHQAGVTVALSGVAVQAAQAVDAAVDAHDRGDNRLAALYAAEAYYGAKDAGTAAGEIDYGRAAQSATGHAKTAAADPNTANGSTGLVKVTVSIGSSHQSSNTSYQQQTQQGSTVTASRDVTIVATGDGTKGADGYAANGDIQLQGAQVQAGRDATLAAARDITLTAGQDTTNRDSANHSSSASIGVGFALGGEQNGFTIELAAAAARGKGNGDSTTNHATTVNAGDLLSLQSGRDTTLEGAQAYGNTILADIGRSLSLTSTQDTDHYKETYQSASAGLSLCIPPICYGATSGGASYSQSNISNNYQSVTDQTGLAAGSGGFDIHVGDTTTLTGAALASTADPSKNLLDTGNLVVNDLQNSARSSASQMGFSYSSSSSAGSNLASNAMGAALNMAIPQGGSDSSDTASSIAQGTIVVRNDPDQDLSGIDRGATTLNGNGVGNDFDVDKIKENQALGQAAGYVGMRAAGDLADRMYAEAAASGDKEAMAAWSDGGTYKVLLHGLVGAATAELGGGDALQGALGAAASEKASGAMANYLAEHHIDPNGAEGKTLMQLASAAIGGVVGGGAGAVTALDGEKYNRELHPDYVKHLQSQAKAFAEQECGCTLSQLPQDQQDEWLDNATNALLVTAQRLQDDNFNASFDGAPLDAAAEAFLQTDSFGEWIGGTYYDMSHANAEQRADPNINGYALYQQLNSDDNGGLGAIMSATGYSMEQYYVLGRNDYYSGEPQSQAMDEAIYQAQQQSGKDFLVFQGKLMANGMVAGLTGGIGNVAIEATAGTRVGNMLEYALTTRTGTAATGALVNAGAQAMKNDGHINFVEVGTSAASAYLGLGRGFWWNTALGAGANVVNTEYGNLANGTDDDVWLSAGTGALTTGLGYGIGELAKGNKGGMAPVIIGNTVGASSTEALNAYIDKIKNDAKLKYERKINNLEIPSDDGKNK